ncbi:TldD/PmbA family protein [cyanobiont of Ornithocercus magnificus]|nr:TldD/PmbA family protein [cyanobiont of Ornithocercus magnificus]
MPNAATIRGNQLDPIHLRDVLERKAHILGIHQWDLGASYSLDKLVQVDRGEAKQLQAAQQSGIMVRTWNARGLAGVTSTTDLSEAGLGRALEGAHAASAFGNSEDTPSFSPLASASLPLFERPLRSPSKIQVLLQRLREAEADLLGRHNAISTVPYNGLAESQSEKLYLNSEGAVRWIEVSQASLYLYARAEEPGRKPRSSGAIRVGYGSEDIDIESCVNEAAQRTISHLDYRPIATGSYTVCFTPEAFLDLIGAFSSIFNARAILDGISLSTTKSLGTEIAAPFFSLCDDSLNTNYVGALPFDGEGTPTSRITLVNSGRLENVLHSEATARHFGVSPTGHAKLGAKVSVRPGWLEVSRNYSIPTQVKLDHNSCQEKFVLIESLGALHAGVKASQGSFSLPFDGWLVCNGERVSIDAATVAGDIQQVLNSLLHLEDEIEITHQGAAPHVWVESLSITGEA